MIAYASPVTACKTSRSKEGQKYSKGRIEPSCKAVPESEQWKEICELHRTHKQNLGKNYPNAGIIIAFQID